MIIVLGFMAATAVTCVGFQDKLIDKKLQKAYYILPIIDALIISLGFALYRYLGYENAGYFFGLLTLFICLNGLNLLNDSRYLCRSLIQAILYSTLDVITCTVATIVLLLVMQPDVISVSFMNAVFFTILVVIMFAGITLIRMIAEKVEEFFKVMNFKW